MPASTSFFLQEDVQNNTYFLEVPYDSLSLSNIRSHLASFNLSCYCLSTRPEDMSSTTLLPMASKLLGLFGDLPASPQMDRPWRRLRNKQRRARLQKKHTTLKRVATYATSMEAEIGFDSFRQIYLSSLAASGEQQARDARLVQHFLWVKAEQGAWSADVLDLLDGKNILDLCMDMHWNFVVQHIVALCDSEQLDEICLRLQGNADRLARHRIGCRILCRICEQGCASPKVHTFLSELLHKLFSYVDDVNGNFVISKLIENFECFPGREDVLLMCARQPDKSRFAIHCLAEAADLQKLKEVHLETLLAWPGLEAFKHGNVQEQILYEAVQAYDQQKKAVEKEERSTEADSPSAASAGLQPTVSDARSTSDQVGLMAGLSWCWVPAYINFFDVTGQYLGCYQHGYQLCQVYSQWWAPVSTSPKDGGEAQEDEPEPESFLGSPAVDALALRSGSTSKVEHLSWEITKRNAVRLRKNSPTVLHLGKRAYGDCIFGLDLVALQHISTNELLFYKASLKLLKGPKLDLHLRFGGLEESSCRHDFSQQHVCVSCLLQMPLESIREPIGTLVLDIEVMAVA